MVVEACIKMLAGNVRLEKQVQFAAQEASESITSMEVITCSPQRRGHDNRNATRLR